MSPSGRTRLRRRLRRTAQGLVLLALAVLLLGNKWVINGTDDYVFSNWALMPENDVGLGLGTSS